jgi:hypothetical protein
MAWGHQEARPTGAGPGSGTRLLMRGEGTGLLIALPALRECKHPYCGSDRSTPEKGPRGDGRVRGPVREVTRLDGGRPAGALRAVNPLTRKGAALFSAQG